MTTQNYLSQIERLEKMIENKLSEIYRLKAMACGITNSTESERVQTSIKNDKLSSAVSKVIDSEKELEEMVDNLSKKRKHIISQIDNMEKFEHYEILCLRYVNCLKYEKKKKKMNWCERKVYILHKEAIKEFECNYGEEYM